mmetsp:Transcript_36540/g.79622  ORF Transcript_36540/g.79622 Transcript_36540/m.79622 type:complete len:224 (-) Transcript_36540:87-758(-)
MVECTTRATVPCRSGPTDGAARACCSNHCTAHHAALFTFLCCQRLLLLHTLLCSQLRITRCVWPPRGFLVLVVEQIVVVYSNTAAAGDLTVVAPTASTRHRLHGHACSPGPCYRASTASLVHLPLTPQNSRPLSTIRVRVREHILGHKHLAVCLSTSARPFCSPSFFSAQPLHAAAVVAEPPRDATDGATCLGSASTSSTSHAAALGNNVSARRPLSRSPQKI